MDKIARTPTTRRAFRPYKPRRTAFVPVGRAPTVRPILENVGAVERVYLVGAPFAGTAAARAWADSLPAGWTEDPKAGHYLEGEHPALRFRSPDGRRVEILRAAQWYGEGLYTVGDAAGAWELLGDELHRGFGPNATMLTSPGVTGRDLLLRSIPYGTEWPTLPPDLQALIRSTSGQGRIELLPRAGDTIPRLIEYDGRLFYAALCRALPGPGRLETVSEFQGYARARYHAIARVPRDWQERCACGAPGHAGIGLLGDWADGHWRYPSEPGRAVVGWWDGAEIMVALHHGWTFQFHEAIIFDTPTSGPLDHWVKRLLGVRERLTKLATDHETAGQRALALVGVRNIILHTIGALYGASRRITRSVPIDRAGEVPATAIDIRVEGDSIVWAEHGQPTQPEASHPEWSAAIWARARARMLSGPAVKAGCAPMPIPRTGALHVPAGDVLAFRTDALYLTADPDWPDDGAIGRLRRTGHRDGPLPTPRTAGGLLKLAP